MNRYPQLRGLVAATHTPFHRDGSLNLDIVASQAQGLLKGGVGTAFICGTTGESHSLTIPERIQMTRRWGQTVSGTELKVIVHVGHNCQQDAIALARGAGEEAVHGLAAVAPSYFMPATVADLVDFLAPVAAAAPKLPFYFYDIPALTGVNFSPIEFLEVARRRIPNLAGIKFTNADLTQLQTCLQYSQGEFDILYGIDESLLSAWGLGVQGAVGSTYNFAAAISLNIIQAFERGDFVTARAEQIRSIRLVQLLASSGYLASAKFLMGLQGVPVGPVRSPLRALSEADQQQLERRIKDSEFSDLVPVAG